MNEWQKAAALRSQVARETIIQITGKVIAGTAEILAMSAELERVKLEEARKNAAFQAARDTNRKDGTK